MRISDWSSDLCSSVVHAMPIADRMKTVWMMVCHITPVAVAVAQRTPGSAMPHSGSAPSEPASMKVFSRRSEEHTSELQSLMRISYAVFCLKKKKTENTKEI